MSAVRPPGAATRAVFSLIEEMIPDRGTSSVR
jgi:hypothetical protein